MHRIVEYDGEKEYRELGANKRCDKHSSGRFHKRKPTKASSRPNKATFVTEAHETTHKHERFSVALLDEVRYVIGTELENETLEDVEVLSLTLTEGFKKATLVIACDEEKQLKVLGLLHKLLPVITAKLKDNMQISKIPQLFFVPQTAGSLDPNLENLNSWVDPLRQ